MLIRSLPAGSGGTWVRDGWRLFIKQPLGLSAMVVVYLMMLLTPAMVPVIGIAISGVLAPFATVALLAACREVDRKRAPNITLFAQPFQDEKTRLQLFQLGLINAGLLLVVATAATLLGPDEPARAPTSLEELPVDALVMQLLLYTPVLMLMWFAPVLAGWHQLTPSKAMFGSVVACWRNKGALLIFGVVVTALMIAVSFVSISVLSMLLSSRQLVSVLLAPVALLMMTVVQASFYPMYRSVFETE